MSAPVPTPQGIERCSDEAWLREQEQFALDLGCRNTAAIWRRAINRLSWRRYAEAWEGGQQ